jgi:hypothetical protein
LSYYTGTGENWVYATNGGTVGTRQVLHIGYRNTTQFVHAFYSDDLTYTNASSMENTWVFWSITFNTTTRLQTIIKMVFLLLQEQQQDN